MTHNHILTREQFEQLYLMARKLYAKRIETAKQVGKADDIAWLDQAHQMFKGAIELISNSFTDIKN